MKNKYLFRGLLPIAALFHGFASAQTLVHYWNFNNNASVAAITTPTVSLLNGSISAVSTGTGNTDTFIDFAGGTAQNFNIQNLNARNGDPSGTHLRYNFPINGNVQFSLPTTGYNGVVVKFTTRRSGSGAGTQNWSYSLDGTNFTAYQTVTTLDANPQLITFDFSSVTGVSNNPNFKLKVEFATGAGGNVGNNRFDNFTVDANPISGADTTAPTVTYSPANNTNNASTTLNPTIAFNENIRLVDNSAITDLNAQNLVELRSNNDAGSPVPFTTTFADNKITVIPTGGLIPNQAYYLALKPNMVEDASNNAVTAATSSSFATAGTTVSFDKTFIKVNEDAGTLAFKININNPSNATVNLAVKPAPFSTADSSDFTLSNQTITITPATTSAIVNIPITDDTLAEQQAEYFVLGLENAVGTSISGDALSTVYIIDNDKQAPTASK
ncbi:MAG: alkaline phosphatase, partial [Chryseobacterium sp.]